MFCKECGKPLSENAKFCENCGSMVGKGEESQNREGDGNPAAQPTQKIPFDAGKHGRSVRTVLIAAGVLIGF